MRDLLDRGSDWLRRKRRGNAARTVHYVRGTSSISLPATLGSTDFQRDDGNGFAVNFQSVDFLIDVADLVIDGVPTEPQRGDRVVVGELDEGGVHEVMSDLGGPPYRFSDPYRRVYRIHTKRVETRP